MKNFYHICLTAHSEVLLRNEEDVALTTNLSALAAYRTGTQMLTDSQMSTHLHENVMTEDPERFSWTQRLSVTKGFNAMHHRKGKLFDENPYILQIHGPRHMQMALNYTLRQGLHHGQSETAFSYPWSTCNQLFVEERGLEIPKPYYVARNEVSQFLPKNADFPDCWQLDENGILLRRSFEETALVENWYGTARGYMFSMIRRTSEEWLAEQQADGVAAPPVTLEMIEQGYGPEAIKAMLAFEGNSKYVRRGMSDMELCKLIDGQMLGRFHVDSVYRLSLRQKQMVAEELRCDLGIRSEKQIYRCLAMGYGL